MAAELATGKASVLPQPDTYGRPILFIRTAKHVTGQFPIADSKRLCVHMIEQAISALPPGKEQFLGLFDLRGFSVANSDLEFASFLVRAADEQARSAHRLFRVLLADALAAAPLDLTPRPPKLTKHTHTLYVPCSCHTSTTAIVAQIEAFFKYYPRRVGQVLLVESPWLFKPLWQVLKPLMGKYSALVRFVSVDDLKKEFFTPETLPAEFK